MLLSSPAQCDPYMAFVRTLKPCAKPQAQYMHCNFCESCPLSSPPPSALLELETIWVDPDHAQFHLFRKEIRCVLRSLMCSMYSL